MNPAKSAAQYGMAQAVLSGKSGAMPVEVARELVEKTTPKMRSKFARELAKTHSNPRFLTESQMSELFNLYHLARTALSGTGKTSEYDRMIWATNEFHKAYPDISSTAAYKDLSAAREEWTGFAGGGNRGRRRTRNPEDSAASMYESFHGAPSTGTLVIQDDVHYHEHLAELGVLCGLKVRTVSGYDVTLEFGGMTGDASVNPKRRGKGTKKGPLTQAYEFGTGIVPGILKGADSTLTNPSQARYLQFGTTMQSELDPNGDTTRGATIRVPHGTRIVVLKKSGHRSLVKGVWDNRQFYGWLDDSDVVTASTYRSTHGDDPEGMQHNPSPEVERAYHAAMLADELYHSALEQEYGKRAGDMRYQSKEQAPHVRAAGKRMQEAADAYRLAVAKMRRGNPRERMIVSDEQLDPGDHIYFADVHGKEHQGIIVREVTKREHGTLKAHGYIVQPFSEPRRSNHATTDIGPVILCSNEYGNQLYFRGGDQSLNLDDLHMSDLSRDYMNIGEVWAIAYSTKKEFDQFQEIEYVHCMGDEKLYRKLPKNADLWEDAEPPADEAFGNGSLPTLTYDTMNQALGFVGGGYKIEKPFMGTSPGIEG